MFVRFARFEDADPKTRDARVEAVRRDIEKVKAGGVPDGAPPEAGEALRASVSRVLLVVEIGRAHV